MDQAARGRRPPDDDRTARSGQRVPAAARAARAVARHPAPARRGATLGAETSIDKVLVATGRTRDYDAPAGCCPACSSSTTAARQVWRAEYLYSRAATIYGGTAEVQRNIIARRLLDLGAAAWDDPSPLASSIAKAVAGASARTVARHAQQVLGGMGYTTDHPLHRYVRRTLVLDQLLGSGRALTREIGEQLLRERELPAMLPL
jgi:alkylation response protein AidB-like acyl-CoA dehydrogenase